MKKRIVKKLFARRNAGTSGQNVDVVRATERISELVELRLQSRRLDEWLDNPKGLCVIVNWNFHVRAPVATFVLYAKYAAEVQLAAAVAEELPSLNLLVVVHPFLTEKSEYLRLTSKAQLVVVMECEEKKGK